MLPRPIVLALLAAACAGIACADGPVSAARAAEVPKRVVVLDADANVIGVIAAPRALLEVAGHLDDARPAVPPPADPAWRWRLDVTGPSGTVRWRYANAGLLTRADRPAEPVLRIADPAGFATLLGLPAR